jgi:hypothetical protein
MSKRRVLLVASLLFASVASLGLGGPMFTESGGVLVSVGIERPAFGGVAVGLLLGAAWLIYAWTLPVDPRDSSTIDVGARIGWWIAGSVGFAAAAIIVVAIVADLGRLSGAKPNIGVIIFYAAIPVIIIGAITGLVGGILGWVVGMIAGLMLSVSHRKIAGVVQAGFFGLLLNTTAVLVLVIVNVSSIGPQGDVSWELHGDILISILAFVAVLFFGWTVGALVMLRRLRNAGSVNPVQPGPLPEDKM